MLPMSPQPWSGDNLKPNYVQKRVFAGFWALMPKYGYLAPDPQNLKILENLLYDPNHLNNTLLMSPEPISGDDLNPSYQHFSII